MNSYRDHSSAACSMWLAWLGALLLSACAESAVSPPGGANNAGALGIGGSPILGGAGGSAIDVGDGAPADVPALDDFPAAPVFVGKADATTQMAFGGTGSGAGPCVVSPEDGTLFPKNWLRPRLEVAMPKDHNAVEFRLSVDGFAHPLLAYSTDPSFTLDKEMWKRLTITAIKKPVTVQVRTAQIDAQGKAASGPTMPSEVKFSVAPAEAPGKIVYWALPMGFTNSGVLKGFGIGEEGVRDVLTADQVKAVDGKGQCIGCHTGTPDGKAVSFQLSSKLTLADVEDGAEGTVPPIGNAATLATLRTLNGIPSFSPAHWKDGDHVEIANEDILTGKDVTSNNMVRVLLDDGSKKTIVRTGDPNKFSSTPSFSHDGKFIVYVSTSTATADGRQSYGPLDIYQVAYNDGNGGTATPIKGAATGDNEYYPSLSPDDKLVAYTHTPGNIPNAYDMPPGEIFVVPPDGSGASVRLKANDQAECAKMAVPSDHLAGLTDSWAKWSPLATTVDGKTYYFLTFSSRRRGPADTTDIWGVGGRAQLYVTVIVSDGKTLTTYPALYLWNQPPLEGNHTPAWDNFQIPPVPAMIK